ncbi:hypothetical protein [Streptosporangium sp. G12]
MKTLQFGDVLNNGGRVLHYVPGVGCRSGYVFAIYRGQFVSWRTPRDRDGNLGEVEHGRYFGDDFDRGWAVHRLRSGLLIEISAGYPSTI